MKKSTRAFFGFCLFLSSLNASEFAKPKKIDLKNGEKIYNTQCVSCHGQKGIADI